MYKFAVFCLVLYGSLAVAAPAPQPRKPKPFSAENNLNNTKYEFSWGDQKGTYAFSKDGSFDCYLGPSRYYGTWSYDAKTGKIWTNETSNGRDWSVFVYHIGPPKDYTKFSCPVFKHDPQNGTETKITESQFHTPKKIEEKKK